MRLNEFCTPQPTSPIHVAFLLVVSLSFAFMTTTLVSQTSPWPPITADELAMKADEKNPGAAAIVLDRESLQDDVNKIRRERYRIKIFKEEGKAYADVIIPYLPGRTEVQAIQARTVRGDGNSTEFTGQVFDRVIIKSKRFKYQAKAFTLPGVEAGTIVEYSYILHSRLNWPDCVKNPANCWITGAYSVPTGQWTIQHDLYTRHARFSIRPLPKASLFWATIRLPNGVDLQRQPDGSFQLELRDIAPLEKEDYMPPEDMLNGRIHLYYGFGFVPGAPPELFWHDYGKFEGEELERFIGHYKTVERLTSQLIKPTDSPEDKLRKIYARVQELRYVSYETSTDQHLKENKNVEDVLKRGYAYANEINYLFAAMARAAGFPARIVELVDRSKSVFDPVVFDPSRLDAKVVVVHVGQQDLFFDPATRYCPYGLLPWGESGVTGILIDPLGGTYVKIHGQGADSARTVRVAKLKLNGDGGIEGKLEVSFIGQEALEHRLDFYDDDEAGRRKAIEDEIKAWLPASSSVSVQQVGSWNTSDNELRVQCTVSVPKFAAIVGRRILFPPALLQSTRTHPLQHPTRSYPVYFNHAYKENDTVNIDLPEGFRVEGVPAGRSYTNDYSRYLTTFNVQGTTLQFQRSFEVDGFFFPPYTYALLKKTFDTVVSGDADKIILHQLETAQR